jgi:hypothetical protein
MVAAKFRGRWDDTSLEKDADGNFFIDQPILIISTDGRLPPCPSLHGAKCSPGKIF